MLSRKCAPVRACVRPLWLGWFVARRGNRLCSFLAGIYTWITATPTPTGDPSSARGGIMGLEILGSMRRYRPTWSNRDQIWRKHTPWHKKHTFRSWARLPVDGSFGTLKCLPWPNFGKVCWLRPNGLADLVHFWQTPTLEQQQPRSQTATASPRAQRGSYGSPNVRVLWEGIAQLWTKSGNDLKRSAILASARFLYYFVKRIFVGWMTPRSCNTVFILIK